MTLTPRLMLRASSLSSVARRAALVSSVSTASRFAATRAYSAQPPRSSGGGAGSTLLIAALAAAAGAGGYHYYVQNEGKLHSMDGTFFFLLTPEIAALFK